MIAMEIQITPHTEKLQSLQILYGNPNLSPIYGAGCTENPRLAFLFMNPIQSIASIPEWKGIRAPWVGSKSIWRMLIQLNLISQQEFLLTQELESTEWTPEFVQQIYSTLADNRIYITNLAKCTQNDARPLDNATFQAYLPYTQEELKIIQPQSIIAFGNQVSSIFIQKPISISAYTESYELVNINGLEIPVYPTYYPVGIGIRNMPKAIERIQSLL